MKIWQGYCKVTDVLVRIGLVIGGIAVCAAAALVTVDVFLRGIFNVSTMIADEYSCYFCVAMTFFGGAMAYRQGSFINVDIFYAKIKPEVRKWLDLVLNLIGIAFVIFLLSKARYITSYSFTGDVRSASISRTPLFIPQGCMFVGLIIFLMEMVVCTFDPFITGGKNLMEPVGEAMPDESEFEKLGTAYEADGGEAGAAQQSDAQADNDKGGAET